MNQRIRKVLCIAIIFIAVYCMREFITSLYTLRPSQIHVYPIVGESYLTYLSNVLHRKGFWVSLYGLVLLVYCLVLTLCESAIEMKEESSLNELVSRLIMVILAHLVIAAASSIGMMRFPFLTAIVLAFIIVGTLYAKKYYSLNEIEVSKQHCAIVILIYFVFNFIMIHDSWLIAVLMTITGIAVIMLWRFFYVFIGRLYERLGN